MEEFERLSLLIDRLLFLVRVDNNQLKPVINSIDVRAELENIVEFYSESITDKGVTAFVVGSSTLAADSVLFSRAVGNLLTNALKYSGQGGTVTLATIQGTDTLEVSVSDTGCGIDPAVLPKVFDRYFWIEASRNKDAKGTGLGLDIVKAIMKLHGGSVDILSEPGIGTTVKLLFPQNR
jgi:two-component system heavy metal sensor histidine kinase CusS